MSGRQDGMVMPLMLLFLALITVVVSRVHSLAGQQRETAKEQVLRSQADSQLFNAEAIVLHKLPQLDIPLFQRLTGQKENAPLVFSFPMPSGDAQVTLTSARQCLNLAPLWEDDASEKSFTLSILSRLMTKLNIGGRSELENIAHSKEVSVVPPALKTWVCYLPNAGQQWDIRQLDLHHLPLLEALLPEENALTLKNWLTHGIKAETQKRINETFNRDILVSESNYYWLELKLQEEDTILRARELIHIQGRSGHIVRRRLLDDNAL